MKTAKGTDCNGKHQQNPLGARGSDLWSVMTINGRRYTVCAHEVRPGVQCGALIDVTDTEVVICCGNESKHDPDAYNI